MWSAHRSVTFWKSRPVDGVKWGHWSHLKLNSVQIYQKVSVDLRQGRRWGLAASGPHGCHGNHCAPMLATTVSRERAQGNCGNDRMVWAAFLPQVPGLARARPLVPFLDVGGYALW